MWLYTGIADNVSGQLYSLYEIARFLLLSSTQEHFAQLERGLVNWSLDLSPRLRLGLKLRLKLSLILSRDLGQRQNWGLLQADGINDEFGILSHSLERHLIGDFMKDEDLESALKTSLRHALFIQIGLAATEHFTICLVALLFQSRTKSAHISPLQAITHNGERDITGTDIGSDVPMEMVFVPALERVLDDHM